MKCFLTFITLCFVGIHAIPKPAIQQELYGLAGTRVGGGVRAYDSPHACMVLVHRQNLAPGDVILGGGSIVSRRRVLTAAHLVHGTNTLYQVGFFELTSRRIVESEFVLIHSNFNLTTYNNDIAFIFFDANIFPERNIIPFSTTPDQPTPPSTATLVGFGFTNAESTGASFLPYAAAQSIAIVCAFDNFEAAPTHFCAIDETTQTTWVWPGDNGAGLYVPGATIEDNLLVGVASRILPGCYRTQLTAYTRVSTFATWIYNLL